jgi:hypothetical protein
MGKEHEEAVVEAFAWANARRSKSSGASFHDPIDVTTEVTVTECEATEGKSYSLKLSFWEEIVSKQHSGKMPSLAVRFRDTTGDKHIDLFVMSLADASALLEELEVYRNDSLERT